MKKYLLLFGLVFCLAFMGCSGNKIGKGKSIQEIFEKGNSYFEIGKYRKAIQYYEIIIFEKRSGITAEAQMKLGDCYFNLEDYAEALVEYEDLIKLFPDYQEVNRAYFNIGVCHFENSLSAHYTQEETNDSIEAFKAFLEKFPNDEKSAKAIEYIRDCQKKLIKKNFYNGYIYYKTYDYSSALLYFNEILELGNHDEIEEETLYYCARIYIKRGDESKARKTMERLEKNYPYSKFADKLRIRLKKNFS